MIPYATSQNHPRIVAVFVRIRVTVAVDFQTESLDAPPWLFVNWIFHGPPRRTVPVPPAPPGDSSVVTEAILKATGPTYYITKRAWTILGYFGRPKPAMNAFISAVNALWRYQATDRRLRGRSARACMLDALRTLGFRNPRWTVNVAQLWMRPEDQDGSWQQIPGPTGGTAGRPDARQYLALTAPLAASREDDQKAMADDKIWRDFHPYQGFRMRDSSNTELHLRAIPVPKGADSMWQSISYWIYQRRNAAGGAPAGQGGRSIWKGRQADFGTLSMARSLHASQQQGKPAYPHHYLLYVVADYFNAKVVLLTSAPKPPIRTTDFQSTATYTHTVYGHHDSAITRNHPHILLMTNANKTHYDPVDFDNTPLHAAPGWTAGAPPPPQPNPFGQPMPFAPPLPPPPPPAPTDFQTHPGEGDMCGPTGPCPWWPGRPARQNLSLFHPPVLVTGGWGKPPCEAARYNYLTAGETAGFLALYPNGTIPSLGFVAPAGTPVPLFAPSGVAGRMVGFLPAAPAAAAVGAGGWWGEVTLTDALWRRFQAGIDIPGAEFDVPADAVMDGWDAAARQDGQPAVIPAGGAGGVVHNPLHWQWRFGPRPMGFDHGVRLPKTAVPKGRHMLDDPYVVFGEDKWRAEP
ncbi:hypothetical protein C8A00DRAFT_44733 [Chaetomidium leptoderma]|uniref:Uncharacterized protein n=1 Tax=Chaetomidium leptoderma TaxID=669021 RepID=A0AAN6VJ22_9PEZI|nr:hypothetical protein C8A00DRAFT_44733 [Chaetomidium leptoderma]